MRGHGRQEENVSTCPITPGLPDLYHTTPRSGSRSKLCTPRDSAPPAPHRYLPSPAKDEISLYLYRVFGTCTIIHLKVVIEGTFPVRTKSIRSSPTCPLQCDAAAAAMASPKHTTINKTMYVKLPPNTSLVRENANREAAAAGAIMRCTATTV
ncbi:hypothetical protein H4582DRAFT_1916906 [Lactarius indigo]|nr:hypothetical protein H4582DRAFT_1916906 [Lactarius indigo]